MTLSTVLLAVLLPFASTVDLQVASLPSRGKLTLALGAKGKADVERLATLTRVTVALEMVQPAALVQPGMNAYVVWAVSPEGSLDNLGELAMDADKGSLEATTSFDRLALLITAEPHYLVDRPNAVVAYKNAPARETRSIPLTLDVGEYAYGELPPRVFGVPPLVTQARAAVAIAQAAGAERRAEAEFRQARIALDTLEELQRRTSPPDVISSAAHETIRRAQRAASLARQSVR